jgi:hypothetical protein
MAPVSKIIATPLGNLGVRGNPKTSSTKGGLAGNVIRPSLTMKRRVAGTYSDAQREWLVAIRDHLSVNIEIRPEDMMDAPDFFARRRQGARCSARACRRGVMS